MHVSLTDGDAMVEVTVGEASTSTRHQDTRQGAGGTRHQEPGAEPPGAGPPGAGPGVTRQDSRASRTQGAAVMFILAALNKILADKWVDHSILLGHSNF